LLSRLPRAIEAANLLRLTTIVCARLFSVGDVMIQPDMPDMNDPAEFLKKIWGTMPASLADVPGIVIPTLSLEEIDKQIADLKAVEGWLEMNRNMLRSTIQALEVQKATVANLHAMNDAAPDEKNAASVDPAAWWNELQAHFKQAVESAISQQTTAPSAKKTPSQSPKAAPAKKATATSAAKHAAKKTSTKPARKAVKTATRKKTAAKR